MLEKSYDNAIISGCNPRDYDCDMSKILLQFEGKTTTGKLDALVWAKHKPILIACITLDNTERISLMAYKDARESNREYRGWRLLSPGQSISITIRKGQRGALHPIIQSLT